MNIIHQTYPYERIYFIPEIETPISRGYKFGNTYKNIQLESVNKLNNDKKKYEAIFIVNGKKVKQKFGAEGMSDYTIHKDIDRRNRYINRHMKDLRTKDPTRAGYLSMFILWNKNSLNASINDYKRRLNTYNKTGTFPVDIKNYSNNFGESKIPDNVKNKKLYQQIKNSIRAKVDKDNRRWGAYDSSRLVQEYKKKGGTYLGGKKDSNLSRWHKEKWIDACLWPIVKPCGRSDMSSSIAYCRPSIKVNNSTPKLVQKLTPQEIFENCKFKKTNPKKIIS